MEHAMNQKASHEQVPFMWMKNYLSFSLTFEGYSVGGPILASFDQYVPAKKILIIEGWLRSSFFLWGRGEIPLSICG